MRTYRKILEDMEELRRRADARAAKREAEGGKGREGSSAPHFHQDEDKKKEPKKTEQPKSPPKTSSALAIRTSKSLPGDKRGAIIRTGKPGALSRRPADKKDDKPGALVKTPADTGAALVRAKNNKTARQPVADEEQAGTRPGTSRQKEQKDKRRNNFRFPKLSKPPKRPRNPLKKSKKVDFSNKVTPVEGSREIRRGERR